jgi:hypothetical protein
MEDDSEGEDVILVGEVFRREEVLGRGVGRSEAAGVAYALVGFIYTFVVGLSEVDELDIHMPEEQHILWLEVQVYHVIVLQEAECIGNHACQLELAMERHGIPMERHVLRQVREVNVFHEEIIGEAAVLVNNFKILAE